MTEQSPNDERARRINSGKTRDSDHDMSAKSSKNASRESSCSQIDSTPKKPLLGHDAHADTPKTNNIKTLADTKDQGVVLPLFPNLRASKPKVTHGPKDKTRADTVPSIEHVNTPSEDVGKGPTSTKWVKTARGSIRLASDASVERIQDNADKKDAEVKGGQHASIATARRRSRRLASMTPDVEDSAVQLEPRLSQPTANNTNALATAMGTLDPAPFDAELESEPASHDRTTHPTDHEEVPIQDRTVHRTLQGPKIRENTFPIPGLVADIEKIIQSSPLADRISANDGTKRRIALTPAEALKKRIPASVLTRTRALPGSGHLVEKTSKSGIITVAEQSDSESSKLDGAFDDSLRGRTNKVAQGAHGAFHKFKPNRYCGIKKSAREQSQDEGNADVTRARRRRKPDSDGSKFQVNLSSANAIETATSRAVFSVDDPSVEEPIDIGEFARRFDEPANAVMLAQMVSTNPIEADGATDTTPANDGSHGTSQSHSPDGDSHKCADCGRTPERYLVCAKCRAAIYCGKYCQLWNWPLHKTCCKKSDEADQPEIELQEAYMRDMWAAALSMLKEEAMAGGTVESLLLGEAVRHSPAHPTFMGQGSSRVLVGFDVNASQLALRDPRSMDKTRAMSMWLAQAAQGNDE